jgi:hypothetical protein
LKIQLQIPGAQSGIVKWILFVASNALIAVGLLIIGTIFFDIIHYVAHSVELESLAWLRKWHWSHHRFFGPNLVYDDAFLEPNIKHHLTLESLAQIIPIIALSALILSIDRSYLLGCFGVTVFCVIRWIVQVTSLKGKDSHHPELAKTLGFLPAHLDNFFVGAEYHCYHHVWPNTHFGSMISLVDNILGTSLQLKNRRVTVSGAGGAFRLPKPPA